MCATDDVPAAHSACFDCDHFLRQKSKCVYCKGIKQRVEDERQKQLDCVGVRVAVRSILLAVE